MIKIVSSLKHLLEDGEEILMSILLDGVYHILVYNKNYDVMFYFKADNYGDTYMRKDEEIITQHTFKDKLSSVIGEKALKFLEGFFSQKQEYGA